MAVLSDVFLDVCRICATIRTQGTSISSSTTTFVDGGQVGIISTLAPVAGNYITSLVDPANPSTAGQHRRLSGFTIGSGTHTWAVALTHTPSATTQYVCTVMDPTDILNAITDVMQRNRRRQALPYPSTSLVTNSLFDWYGDFEEWNTAATVPTGWTATNATGAQVSVSTDASNPPQHGNYALEVTDSGSGGGYFSRFVPPFRLPALVSKTVTLRGYARVESGVTARVSIIATDNAGNVTTGTFNLTSASWIRIEDAYATNTFTMPATLSSVEVRLISVGAGGITHYDDIKLTGPSLLTQRLPANLAALPKILLSEGAYPSRGMSMTPMAYASSIGSSDADAGNYWRPLQYGRHWTVYTDPIDGFSYIQWLLDQPSGNHVFIDGYSYPTITGTSAFTATVDVDAGWLALATAAEMLEGQIDAIRYPALAGTPTLLSRVQARLTDKASGNGETDTRMRGNLIYLNDF